VSFLNQGVISLRSTCFRALFLTGKQKSSIPDQGISSLMGGDGWDGSRSEKEKGLLFPGKIQA
jgi:hypothetical protein